MAVMVGPGASSAVSLSGSAASWVEQPYRLKFVFAERRLFAVTVHSLALNTHFLKMEEPPEKALPDLKGLPFAIDAVLLSSVPVESEYKQLSRGPQGWLKYVPRQYPRYYTELSGTFEQYLGGFASKTRATLRRKVRKFEEVAGGLDCREYRTPEEVEAFLVFARELSRRTYQHRLFDKGLPDSQAFLSTMRTEAAADRVRAYLLFLAGRPVAYLYCPVVDGILIYEYLGYDAGHSGLSCGSVLQYLAFERLFAEGRFVAFDFTEGEGEHKKLFATGRTLCADIVLLRPTMRNMLLVGAHAAFEWLSDSAVRLVDALGLKKRIKKALRRG